MSKKSDLVCWNCGASLQELSLPLRRLEVCPECDSELHVCRMCLYYESNAIEQCAEEAAEEVRDKARANFCDYYKPHPGAYQVLDPSPAMAARNRLNDLFDQSPGIESDHSPDAIRKRLEDLFK